jgi:hypothetical protein
MEFARQDDCLEKMIPSDLRLLVGQRDRAIDLAEEQNKTIMSLIEERDRLKSREKCFINEIKNQEKLIADYRITKFTRFNNDECWIYDEDIGDENHLESLVCPVVIRAKFLKELFDTLAMKDKCLASAHARNNIFIGLVLRLLEGDELIGSDWDYISEDEYQQIKQSTKKLKAEAIKELKFPTMLRQMWSGGDVQSWLDNQRKLLDNSDEEQTQTSVPEWV